MLFVWKFKYRERGREGEKERERERERERFMPNMIMTPRLQGSRIRLVLGCVISPLR